LIEDAFDVRPELLVEPFAGGASTSLHLLAAGKVNRALLGDADPMVAAFWQVACADSERLVARMREEHEQFLSGLPEDGLARWDYWKRWVPQHGARAATIRFERAAQCLFLNRTTFSGILHGHAGPIGGRAQVSPYGIGCRYTPHELASRIEYVGELYESGRIVDVLHADWRATLNEVASTYKVLLPERVVAYLDPPYMEKADRLYPTSMDPRSLLHLGLAYYLRTEARFRWILSYDNHPDLMAPAYYGSRRMIGNAEEGVKAWAISKRLIEMNYSASSGTGRGRRKELLVTTLPPSAVPTTAPFEAVEA
jgi:DNA adenine methylase